MKKYEYLLFDADNTLLDFSKAEYLAFRETCSASGIEFSEELYSTYSEINDSLWKKIEKKEITLDFLKLERFRLLLRSIGNEECEETLKKAGEMRDLYIESLAEQSCLIDGAEECVAALSKKYKMYIVTNGIAKIQRKRFFASSIKQYFSEIFISEEIGAAKPSPLFFDQVLERIGESDRSKYLVIGDSLTSDCDGAIGYGIDICRYNPNNLPDNGRKLTYNIEKLSELNEIL
ncbi:MAG: noncanonical pyrimidine nucleotidase, YjjG family [Ruminococcaceae bacterium]|nr:noncanonical pyrimidine nucleotidase, YjjG family [Oscillospiraceae bacterium]